MAYIHFSKSGILPMSTYILLLLFILMNNLSFVKLKTQNFILSNATCINIPFASLSSRNNDKIGQLKLFTSSFSSIYSNSCGNFTL